MSYMCPVFVSMLYSLQHNELHDDDDIDKTTIIHAYIYQQTFHEYGYISLYPRCNATGM